MQNKMKYVPQFPACVLMPVSILSLKVRDVIRISLYRIFYIDYSSALCICMKIQVGKCASSFQRKQFEIQKQSEDMRMLWRKKERQTEGQ